MPHMTRSDLIRRMAERQPQLSVQDVDFLVRLIFSALSKTMAGGGRIEIRGFGSFSLNYRPPRQGRNPKTGEYVAVPAKFTPHFKPGKELRDRVNGNHVSCRRIKRL